jgi:hypothetical protein
MSLTKATYSMIDGAPVNVLDYGASPSATSSANATAFQAAINACVANRQALYIPGGDYSINATLTITGGIHIYGDRMTGSYITVFGGVSCFSISAGVTFVAISNLSIGQSVRYTVTPNSATAILINGTTASQCYWHTYQNLFIDGFEQAISAGGLCSSTITNVSTAFGKNGLDFSKQCLNNIVTANHIVGGTTLANSYGIRVGDGLINPEGLLIGDNLIFGFGRGVWINAAINVVVHHNIIDFAYEFGVIAQTGTTAACFNNTIESNYIALGGSSSGLTGVYYVNNYAAADGQNNGTVIANNEILSYAGATLDNGILIEGTGNTKTSILGNRVKNSALYDCQIKTGTGHRVSNNLWMDKGFLSLVYVSYSNNIGTLATASLITGVPQANTNAGTTSVPNTTVTTLFTLPAREGLYQITAYLSSTNAPADFAASMLVFYNGVDVSPAGAIQSQNNGANFVLTLSGGKNIRLAQTSGATQTVNWSYIQIGA